MSGFGAAASYPTVRHSPGVRWRGIPDQMSRQACIQLARRFSLAPADVIERWDERAAIREFEGGQDRASAEHDALDDVRRELEPEHK
jgi:hypothetical protein